jgi:hypothetical protein
MLHCPRSHRCSANKCPIDPDHLLRKHVPGDPICEYLKRLVKGSETCDLPTGVASAVVRYCDYLYSPRGINEKGLHDIRRRLFRASTQPVKTIPIEKIYE